MSDTYDSFTKVLQNDTQMCILKDKLDAAKEVLILVYIDSVERMIELIPEEEHREDMRALLTVSVVSTLSEEITMEMLSRTCGEYLIQKEVEYATKKMMEDMMKSVSRH